MSSRFSGNSEAVASELLENLDMFPRYYISSLHDVHISNHTPLCYQSQQISNKNPAFSLLDIMCDLFWFFPVNLSAPVLRYPHLDLSSHHAFAFDLSSTLCMIKEDVVLRLRSVFVVNYFQEF